MRNISETNEAVQEVVFYLAGNCTHSILQKDIYTNSSEAFASLFKSKLLHITIKPFFCSEFNTKSNLCIESFSKVQINIKTTDFIFYISEYLEIQNVILSFSDAVFNDNFKFQNPGQNFSNENHCFNKKTVNCCDKITKELNDSNLCSITRKNLQIKENNIYGFFNLENINNSTIPTLILKNAGIQNLFSGFLNNNIFFSVISILSNRCLVRIEKTVLDNFFLKNGIIFNVITKKSIEIEKAQIFIGSSLFKNIIIPFNIQKSSLFIFENVNYRIFFLNNSFFNFPELTIFNITKVNNLQIIQNSFDNLNGSMFLKCGSSSIIFNSTNIKLIYGSNIDFCSIKKSSVYFTNFNLSNMKNSSFYFVDSFVEFTNSWLNELLSPKDIFTSKNSYFILKNNFFFNFSIDHLIFILNSNFNYENNVFKDSNISEFIHFDVQENYFFNIKNSIFVNIFTVNSLVNCINCRNLVVSNSSFVNITGAYGFFAESVLVVLENCLFRANRYEKYLIFSNKNVVQIFIINNTEFFDIQSNMLILFTYSNNYIYCQFSMIKSKIINSIFYENCMFLNGINIKYENLLMKNISFQRGYCGILIGFSKSVIVFNSSFIDVGIANYIKDPSKPWEYVVFGSWFSFNVTLQQVYFIQTNFTKKVKYSIVLYENYEQHILINIIANTGKIIISTSGAPHLLFKNSRITFKENYIELGMPSILITEMSSLKLNALFINNEFICSHVQTSGSFINVNNLNSISFKNNSFFNSSANAGGHIFFEKVKKITIENCSFQDSVSELGSIMYLRRVDKLLVRNSTMKNFKSLYGGIYCIMCKNIELIDLLFVNGYSIQGSVIFFEDSTLTINSTVIRISSAEDSGGAIYCTGNSVLNAKDLTAYKTRANNGGFLFIGKAFSVNLINLIINDTSARTVGGGVYIWDVANFYMRNCSLSNSVAKLGIIAFLGFIETDKVFTMSEIVCFNNFAESGSCITSYSAFKLKISNIEVNNCTGNVFEFSWVYTVYINFENLVIKNVVCNEKIFILMDIWLGIQNFLFENLNYKEMFYLETTSLTLKNGSEIKNQLEFRNKFINSIESFVLIENFAFSLKKNPLENNNSDLIFLESSKKSKIILRFVRIEGGYNKIKSFFSIKNTNFQWENGSILHVISNVLTAEKSNFLMSDINFTEIFADSLFKLKNYQEENNNITLKNIKFEKSSTILFEVKFINSITADRISINNAYNSTQMTQVFSCKDINNFYLLNSRISNIKKGYATTLYFFSQKKHLANIYLENNVFSNIISNFAGVFLINSIFSVQIKNCSFIHCQAKNKQIDSKISNELGIAGVGFIFCTNEKLCNFTISNSIFINNLAENYSPNIFSSIETKENNNIFKNNLGKIKNNFAFHPKVQFANLQKVSTAFEKARKVPSYEIVLRSGEKYNLEFTLVDKYGEILSFMHNIKFEITLLESNVSVYNPTALLDKGKLFFMSIIFKGKSDTNFKFAISTILINPINEKHPFSQVFKAKFKKCERGEVYNPDGTCYLCPFGTYSLIDPNDNRNILQKCNICPESALCLGGDLIYPLTGYWRPSFQYDYFAACLLEKSCVGALDFYKNNINSLENFLNLTAEEKQFCAATNKGILCNNCKNNYVKTFTGECVHCNKSLSSLAIIKFIIIFLFILFSCMKFVYENIITRPRKLKGNLEGYFKLFINYLQILDVIIQNSIKSLKIQYFNSIISYIRNIINLISLDLYFINCKIEKSIGLEENSFIFEILSLNILPILLSLSFALILFVSMILYFLIKKKSFKLLTCKQIRNFYQFCKKNYLFFFFIASYLLFSSILSKTMSLLKCKGISPFTSETYLEQNLNYTCWEKWHILALVFLGFPAFLLYGLYLPYYIFKILKTIHREIIKNKLFTTNSFGLMSETISRKTDSNKFSKGFQNSYIFFSVDYKEKYYFWECCILLKKFLIMFWVSLTVISEEIKDFLLIFLFMLEAYLILKFKPYVNNSLNFIAFASQIIMGFSVIFIFGINTYYGGYLYFFTIVFILANLTILLSILALIIKWTILNAIFFAKKLTTTLKKKLSFKKNGYVKKDSKIKNTSKIKINYINKKQKIFEENLIFDLNTQVLFY